MQYRRNPVSILICTLMVLICLSSCSKEESTTPSAPQPIEEGSPINWVLADGVLTLTGTGDMPDYSFLSDKPWDEYDEEITSVVISDGITSVGDYAFYDLASLSSVSMGKDVSSIGRQSFANCDVLFSFDVADGNVAYSTIQGVLFDSGQKELIMAPNANTLEGFIIPDTVEEIGEDAFYRSDIVSLEIPSSVKTIADTAFFSCYSLREIVLNEGLETIGESAFMDCNRLESITIPATVKSIGENALGCSGLSAIEVSEESENFISIDGVLFSSDLSTLVAYPASKEVITYEIPEGVETISRYAFSDAKLTEVVFPSSMKTVSHGAFSSSDIVSVHFNEGLKVIEDYSFAYCDNLTAVELPASLLTVDGEPFDSCEKLVNITVLGEDTGIEDMLGTLSGFLYSGDKDAIMIYGYTGSTAEAYAKREGLAFTSLGAGSRPISPSSSDKMESSSGFFSDLMTSVNDALDSASSVMSDVKEDVSNSMMDVKSVVDDMVSVVEGTKNELDAIIDESSKNISNDQTEASGTEKTTDAETFSLPSQPTESLADVNLKIPRWLDETEWVTADGLSFCKIDKKDIYFFDIMSGWYSTKDLVNAVLLSAGNIAGLEIQSVKNQSYVPLVYNKNSGLGIKVIELNNFSEGQFDAYISGTYIGTYYQISGDKVSENGYSDFLNNITGGSLGI